MVGAHGGGPVVWPGAPGSRPGVVRFWSGTGWCGWSGRGAADVHEGGCGVGGDGAGGWENGCLVVILRWRWRWRSVVTRAVAITARAWWWAAVRAGAGSEAVAVPARMVLIRVRRVVVNDSCRAATA